MVQWSPVEARIEKEIAFRCFEHGRIAQVVLGSPDRIAQILEAGRERAFLVKLETIG